MLFTDAFLTNAGAELLTETLSGSRIIWGTCGCTQVDDQDTLNAGTTTFSNFVCKGTASAVFEQANNTAQISCPMSNSAAGCTPGRADAFGLWAKVKNPRGGEGSEVLVLIAKRGASPATEFPEYVDENTNLIGIMDLSVNITEGIVQSIEISRSAYALARDLMTEISQRQEADRRMVSCHKAGQPRTGERQTVYGIKDFQNDIYVGDDNGVTLRLHGEEESHYGYADIEAENNQDGSRARIVFNVDGVNQIEFEGNLIPYEDEEYTLGSARAKWDQVYCRQAYIYQIYTAAIMPDGELNIGSQRSYATSIHTAELNIQSEEIQDILRISANGMAGEATIAGREDLNINADRGTLAISGGTITIGGNSSVNITSAGYVYVSCNGLNVNAPVTATMFNGLLPCPSSTHATPPVGSIFMAYICRRDGAYSLPTIWTGQEVVISYSGSSNLKAYYASNTDGSWTSDGTEIQEMTLKLLSSGFNSTSGGGAVCLVMRTA